MSRSDDGGTLGLGVPLDPREYMYCYWRAYKVHRSLRTTSMLSLMTLDNDYQQECMHRTSQGMHVTDYSPGGSGRDPQPPTQRTLRGCVKTLQI